MHSLTGIKDKIKFLKDVAAGRDVDVQPVIDYENADMWLLNGDGENASAKNCKSGEVLTAKQYHELTKNDLHIVFK